MPACGSLPRCSAFCRSPQPAPATPAGGPSSSPKPGTRCQTPCTYFGSRLGIPAPLRALPSGTANPVVNAPVANARWLVGAKERWQHSAMAFPLDGVRVLDISRVVAGPFAGRMLSDLGADVVKVEPPDGDPTRVWGAVLNGLSGFYTQQNAGKRNICVDLKAPGAAALITDLAGQADVVIENYRPGVMDRLGIGWEQLSAAKPDLIMLSISGFGSQSSWSDRASYAPIIHAESGMVERKQSLEDGAAAGGSSVPSDLPLSVADSFAGLHGVVAVLSALRLRDKTGQGQHIDLSMLNAMTATDDYAHFSLDHEPMRRMGGRVYHTGYGGVMVAGDERAIWSVLNRFGHVVDAGRSEDPIPVKAERRKQLLNEWFGARATRDELVKILEDVNLAYADLPHQREVFDSQVASELGLSVDLDDRGGSIRRVVQSPYRFSNAESGVRRGAPHKGEHNEEVLAEWLGGTPDVRAGVLHSDVP